MTGDAVAGRGRLAEVIGLRGGTAAPEAPFVIEHREALIYMLYEAAELEHGIMCQYLFAAFSGRHEMLHEINRRDVITNLLVWLSGILERSS